MFLDWIICHRDGEEKGQIINREPGSYVEWELNGARKGQIVVSAEEDWSRTIHPGRTRMKVRINQKGNQHLFINGLIANPKASYRTVEIPILDQHYRLLNAAPARVFEVDGDNDFEPETDPPNLELSQLLWKTIRMSDRRVNELNDVEFDPGEQAPTLGIVEGELDDSGIERDWNYYDLNTAWDMLTTRAQKAHVPDFSLRPLDRENGIHAAFDTFYPKMGEDKTERVVFELGYSLADIGWEPSIVEPGICNRYILMGEARGVRAPCYVAENKESINHIGVYQRIEQAPSEADPDQIKDRAEGYVAHHCWPIHFFDLTLPVDVGGTAQGWSRNALGEAIPLSGDQFGVPPVYGVDYGLGDTITVRVQNRFKFGIEDDLPGDLTGTDTDFFVRLTSVKLEEVDKDGNVMVSHSAQPVLDPAAVTGYEAYVAVDGS